ncbi:DNA primase [Capnocytophaga sp. ARDL2]|uniref:DNA primase n=1 Tax=Capnocytophaga sp. ARDL2 TaxID=3238809 RepID=UPI0035593639
MYISKPFIEKLLQSVDILEVFQYIGAEKLQKKGAYYWCCSPFKSEKTPSCQIKVNTQRFIDYSSDISGNAITLLMQKNNLSFVEAVEVLAQMKGIPIEYENQEQTQRFQAKREKKNQLRKYLKAIAERMHQHLLQLPQNHDAIAELQKRHYTVEDIKEWQLGYAPGGQYIYNLFKEVGAVALGKELGLINDNNNDKLWHRLVYPIYDRMGNISGFASRALSEDKNQAKWMNPAENELYKKSESFYGIHAAHRAILKAKRVYIVEGYNDVIAWHKYGLENTVAVCGTAITDIQIEQLGKYTQKVTLCLDGDSAGIGKMMKYLPVFISQGFSVEVCHLPEGLDPDDYSRKYAQQIQQLGLENSLQPYITTGFKQLVVQKLSSGDELDRANALRELTQLIASVKNSTLRSIYTDQLIKEGKQKAQIIKELMREQEAMLLQQDKDESDEYLLPKGVTTPLDQLKPVIEKYQLFVSDNQVFVQSTFEPPYTFKSVSNFSVEILQHMNDEKKATKLLRICNIKNEERIFDIPADGLTAPLEFKKHCSNQGNFLWLGNLKELDKLSSYLYDRMGVGRKVDVLGWNPEGFYCWNNMVTEPGKPPIAIDKNGLFHHDGHTYYVPSANEIYRNISDKYVQQKRIRLHKPQVSIIDYLAQMHKVHREYAVVGMLFAFASAHQDLIVDVAKGFPLLFLYGPPSTGKDELYGCIKKMFGIGKNDSINIESKQSTGKGMLRSFGEFSNMVVHLSEYINGDKEIDGMLKGIWDRSSYKRATIDSRVSTDSTPILCSVIVTGNQTPTNEAVLTRLIYGEMTKNQFTLEESQAFEELENMTTDHITGYMDRVIWYRPLFEKHFAKKFFMYKKILKERKAFKGSIDRIITNYAILGATHEILKETNEIVFPFTTAEMLDVFDAFVSNLKRKLDTANVISRFWDVFVACLSGSEINKLHLGLQLDIQGELLYIRFTEVYNRIQTEWFPRFSESCPSKTTLLEKLKEDKCFVEEKKSHRFANINTSAYVLDLKKIDNRESILFALNLQLEQKEAQQGMPSLFSPPATPNNHNIKEEKDAEDGLAF